MFIKCGNNLKTEFKKNKKKSPSIQRLINCYLGALEEIRMAEGLVLCDGYSRHSIKHSSMDQAGRLWHVVKWERSARQRLAAD